MKRKALIYSSIFCIPPAKSQPGPPPRLLRMHFSFFSRHLLIYFFLYPSSEKPTRTAAEAPTDALFLLFLLVKAEHKMAPNARCVNNGQIRHAHYPLTTNFLKDSVLSLRCVSFTGAIPRYAPFFSSKHASKIWGCPVIWRSWANGRESKFDAKLGGWDVRSKLNQS